MKFTENQLESAIIELLNEEGYQHLVGDQIVRDSQEVYLVPEDGSFLSI